jgi:hypothetical protein
MTTTDEAGAGRIVWKSDDGTIECRLIPRSEREFVVRVDIVGCHLSSEAFVDPIQATVEAARLRRLFLG